MSSGGSRKNHPPGNVFGNKETHQINAGSMQWLQNGTSIPDPSSKYPPVPLASDGLHPAFSTSMPFPVAAPALNVRPDSMDTDMSINHNAFLGFGNGLMNMDIRASQFTNAFNFDAISTGNQTVTNEVKRSSYEEEEEGTGSMLSSQYDDQESLSFASETNSDLIEQHQAKEQAQLLSRFQQLRQWQMQQQQMLVARQQQQLQLLQQEQDKVQNLISKQRQAAWGEQPLPNMGISQPDSNATNHGGKLQVGGQPAAFARGAMAAASTIKSLQASNPTSHLMQPTVNMAVGESFPVVEDNEEESEIGIYDSASNIGMNYSNNGDQAIDIQQQAKYLEYLESQLKQQQLLQQKAMLQQQQKQQHLQQLHLIHQQSQPHQPVINQKQYEMPSESTFPKQQSNLINKISAAGQKGIVDTNKGTDKAYPMAANGSGDVLDTNPIQDNGDPEYNCHHSDPVETGALDAQRLEGECLDFRDDGSENNLIVNNNNTIKGSNIQDSNLEYDDLDESDKSDLDDEEEQEDGQHTDENDLDNQPVSGLGATKKTFQELLEEELQKEEERLKLERQGSSTGAKKHAFLKRGQGLSRFDPQVKSAPNTARSETNKNGKNATRSRSVETRSGQRSKLISSTPVRSNTEKLDIHAFGDDNNKPLSGKLILKTSSESKTNKKSVEKEQQAKVVTQAAPRPDSKPPSITNRRTVVKPEVTKAPVQAPSKLNLIKKKKDLTEHSGKEPSAPGTNGDFSDTSFAQAMTNITHTEKLEENELEEFQLLERYADDNASFLSDLSTVNKVVNEKINPLPTIPSGSSTQAPSQSDSSVDKICLPAEQPASESPSNSDLSNSDTEVEEELPLDDHVHNYHVKHMESEDCHDQVAEKPVQRKVASKTAPLSPKINRIERSPPDTPLVQLEKVETFSDSDSEIQGSYFHRSNWNENKSQKDEVSQAITNVKLNKKINENEDGVARKLNMDADDEGNLTGDEDEEDEEENESDDEMDYNSKVNLVSEKRSGFDFEDEDAWDESLIQEPNLKSLGKGTTPRLDDNHVAKDSPPPTSNLVSKLFPKLRQENDKQKQQKLKAEEKAKETEKVSTQEGVQSKILRDKLLELEREIERFRTENSTLATLRAEREEGLSQMKKEMEAFAKEKDEELKRIQDFKKEELAKIKKERKVFDQYTKANKNLPNKKDREEIERLKKQVTDLEEEMKRKESRWAGNTKRLKDRIDRVESENKELKEEIKLLENRRIESLQKKSPLASAAPTKKANAKEDVFQPTISTSHRSPKPEKLPHKMKDNALSLSTNYELEASFDDTASQLSIFRSDNEIDDGGDVLPRDKQLSKPTYTSRPKSPKSPRRPRAKSGSPSRQPRMERSKSASSCAVRATSQSPGRGGATRSRSIPRKRTSPSNMTTSVDKGDEVFEEVHHDDGKMEKIYSNGAREILFANGTRKQISADGLSIVVAFFNGDMKQTMPDKRVVYFYADAQTTHTTFPDGMEILQFPNKQIEKHYPDGTKEINFPDQTIKYLYPNGKEESIFPDGTVIRIEQNGQKVMEFANGQREIHTDQYKKREYPDGTVKTVYPDGRQETRYSSGRIRVKDKDGNIIVDKRV